MGCLYSGLPGRFGATGRTILLCALMAAGGPLTAQQSAPFPPQQIPPAQPHAPGAQPDEESPASRHMREQSAEKRNAERQKQLVADADKLLLLAQQLKAEVDKSDKNTLSVMVIKKSDEIEKLARSVRQKMKSAE